MNINVTKKEYRLLLEMLSTADWVMHAYANEKKQYHHEHEELKQKLLSYSKEMDADDLIERSPEVNGFYETSEFELSVIDNFVKPYEDAFFMDELVERLATRDVIQSVGMEHFSKMNMLDRMMQVNATKDLYLTEFEKHGVEHIVINNKQ